MILSHLDTQGGPPNYDFTGSVKNPQPRTWREGREILSMESFSPLFSSPIFSAVKRVRVFDYLFEELNVL